MKTNLIEESSESKALKVKFNIKGYSLQKPEEEPSGSQENNENYSR